MHAVRSRQPDDASITDAAIRVLEAGQRIVLDRIELARLDLRQLAKRLLRGAALVIAGAVLLVGSWFALMGSAVVWLHEVLPLAASLGLVGAGSGAFGLALLALGMRRAGRAGEEIHHSAADWVPPARAVRSGRRLDTLRA